jgi:hypothetical protein
MNDFLEAWKRKQAELDERDQAAKAEGKLVGRYIRHVYADSYAVYEIIRETAKSVRIRVVKGLGDDWVLPAWGDECTISRTKAEQFVRHQDALRRMFDRSTYPRSR